MAGPQVTLINMDGMQLRFPDQSFDLVVSSNVLEHVPDDAAVVRGFHRLLKPGGIAVVTVPAHEPARERAGLPSTLDCPAWPRRARGCS